MSEDLRNAVLVWVKKVGRRNATAELVRNRVSPNTAQKLTGGTYPNKPGALLEGAILSALGRVETGDEAS